MYIALFGFSKKQIILLQRVCKLFYKRVAEWIKVVIIFPSIRLSEPVAINRESTENFVFPSVAMMRKWRGVLHTLVGFENNYNHCESGMGDVFNFILSNGTRSAQRDGDREYYEHFIPKKALKKIRSVNIHYFNRSIVGFSFFDKDGWPLFRIGTTTTRAGYRKSIVLLKENEVIVGVVAKLCGVRLSRYSDIQFQIASR